MNKKAGILCMALGGLLILAAAALAIFNQAESSKAAKAAKEVLPQLMEAISNQPQSEGASEAEIDGYEYIGVLSIPALDLELPVMSQWDYTRLKTAPCRYYGSAQTGDLVIAGHNYARHFGRLSELKIGDTVEFTDLSGAVYTYQVGELETLPPEATEEMILSDWDLSLYTCTPSGANRLTVRCEGTGASD